MHNLLSNDGGQFPIAYRDPPLKSLVTFSHRDAAGPAASFYLQFAHY